SGLSDEMAQMDRILNLINADTAQSTQSLDHLGTTVDEVGHKIAALNEITTSDLGKPGVGFSAFNFSGPGDILGAIQDAVNRGQNPTSVPTGLPGATINLLTILNNSVEAIKRAQEEQDQITKQVDALLGKTQNVASNLNQAVNGSSSAE